MAVVVSEKFHSGVVLNDANLVLDSEQRIVALNDRAVELYGYEPQELVGQPLAVLREGDETMASQWKRALNTGRVSFEAVHRRKDRTSFPVEVSSRRFLHEGTPFVSSLIRDISYQKDLEKQNAQLQRVYEALSGANECLIRSETQQELFQAICDIAVKYANFELVRITRVPPESTRLETMAASGLAGTLASSLIVEVDSTSRYSRGVTGRAILGAKSVVEPNFIQDAGPWEEAFLKARVVSAAAMPIYCQGRVFGAISFYGSQPELFQPRFIRVLQCLADDISHALNRLDELQTLKFVQSELATLNQRFEHLLAGSLDLVAAWDTDSRFVLFNQAFQRHLFHGTGEQVVRGQPLREGQGNALVERIRHFQGRTIEGEEHRTVLTYPSDVGVPVSLDTRFTPLRNNQGQITGGFQVARDISEILETAEKLAMFSFAFEHLPVPVRILSNRGDTEFSNLAFSETWPILPGQPTYSWESAPLWRENPVHFQLMKKALEDQGSWSHTVPSGGECDSRQWYDTIVLRIDNPAGEWTKTIEFYFDTTARNLAEESVDFLRRFDQLTKLPNKSSGEAWLQAQLERSRANQGTVGILLINLDRFWVVNDNLGHSYGDHVLQIMASRLTEFVGPDCYLSRLGNDEFLLCVPRPGTEADYLSLGRTVTERLCQPIETTSTELRLTASIGVTLFPVHGDNSHTLVSRARSALATAKGSGRNLTVVYQPELHRISPDYLSISRDLFASITEEHFFLQYQPQLDLHSGRVTGAEALLRWNHPARGIVSPQTFLRVAEDNGLIVPIGSWVLKESCLQGVRWMSQGLPITMAVNVAASQLYRGDFVSTVVDIVGQTGFPPQLLELELTESMLVQDSPQVRQVLADLRGLGIRLSIDDFGTGYSSLSYLKKLDVQRLKIDRSFVSDLDTNLEGRSIVRAIIEMSRALGLETIAEGVESEAVAQVLRNLGCQEVQGFHFSRPLAVADFLPALELLKARRETAASPEA